MVIAAEAFRLFSHKFAIAFQQKIDIPKKTYAGVAELVDALDSESSICKDVRVQISPSAPSININLCFNKIQNFALKERESGHPRHRLLEQVFCLKGIFTGS